MYKIDKKKIEISMEHSDYEKIVLKAIQEMAELTVDLTMFMEGRSSIAKVREESADVLIMVTQVAIRHDYMDSEKNGSIEKSTQEFIDFKLDRRLKRIQE